MKSAKVCDFGIACVWKKLYDSGREFGAGADVSGRRPVDKCGCALKIALNSVLLLHD